MIAPMTAATVAIQNQLRRGFAEGDVVETDASPAGGTVYLASSAWNESTISWNTAPGSTGGAIRAVGAVALDAWVEVDLTGIVTADGQLDLVIKDGNTNSAFYGSRESATAPQLVITQTP